MCRLLSDAFHDYAAHYSTDVREDGGPLMPTGEYLEQESAEGAKCSEMFEVVRKYEASHTNLWQVRAPLCPPNSLKVIGDMFDDVSFGR